MMSWTLNALEVLQRRLGKLITQNGKENTQSSLMERQEEIYKMGARTKPIPSYIPPGGYKWDWKQNIRLACAVLAQLVRRKQAWLSQLCHCQWDVTLWELFYHVSATTATPNSKILKYGVTPALSSGTHILRICLAYMITTSQPLCTVFSGYNPKLLQT